MRRLVALIAFLLLASVGAHAQQGVLQGGSWNAGHVPMYSTPGGGSIPVIQDSGTAAGGVTGVGASEFGITSRASGTGPYANAGSGPLFTNFCLNDGPSSGQYHYLCLGPNNTSGTLTGGVLVYGAAGGASQLPLLLNVNGATYQFPFSVGGIVGPGVTVVGDLVCWNNTIGTLVKDCTTLNAGVTIPGATITTPTISGATITTSTWTGGTITSPTIATPTITSPSVTGGTFAGSPTITTPTISSPTFSGTVAGANTIPLSILQQQSATTILGNTTGSTANVVALSQAQVATQVPLRSYLAGLTLSNDSGTPNSVLDIAAGQATDSTNTVMINLSAFTKSTAGLWVAGSGNNGMGNGLTVGASTWYHVCAIINNGSPDVYFDTDVNCTSNSPASTTARRRIGSFKTNGASQILGFVQDGDYFQWTAISASDFSTLNPGTGATTTLLNVPTGVNILAQTIFIVQNTGGGGAAVMWVNDLAVNSIVPTQNEAQTINAQTGATGQVIASPVELMVRTNTSGQVRYRLSFSDGNTTVTAYTRGWTDTRGRNK